MKKRHRIKQPCSDSRAPYMRILEHLRYSQSTVYVWEQKNNELIVEMMFEGTSQFWRTIVERAKSFSLIIEEFPFGEVN